MSRVSSLFFKFSVALFLNDKMMDVGRCRYVYDILLDRNLYYFNCECKIMFTSG